MNPRILPPLGRVGVLVSVLILLTSGCRPGGEARVGTTVRDSAGVRVVEHPQGSLDGIGVWGVLDTVWSLAGEPDVGSGNPSGVTDAILIDTLRVAVLSRIDKATYIFSRETHVPVVVGREGDGPGEFRSPVELIHWAGDEFGVWDDAASVVTVYDGEGEMVEREALPPQYTIQRGQRLVGRVNGGGIVAPITPLELEVVGSRRHPLVVGLHQDSLHLRLFPPGEPRPLDLISLPGVDRVGTGKGRSANEWAPLFGRRPLAAIAGGEVVVAAADRFSLRYLVGPEVVQDVRMAYQAPIATRQAKSEAIQAWGDTVRMRSPVFRRPRDDDPSQLTTRDTLPVFAGIIGEASGALWVALYPEDYSERLWVCMGPEGDLLGRIALGAEVKILDVRFPFLLVRIPEDYGLTSIHMLRLGTVTELEGE